MRTSQCSGYVASQPTDHVNRFHLFAEKTRTPYVTVLPSGEFRVHALLPEVLTNRPDSACNMIRGVTIFFAISIGFRALNTNF